MVEAGLQARRALWATLDDPVYWGRKIRQRAALYIDTLSNGGTLYFAGNGGSAATAQHMAAEYVGRFRRERQPFRAVALTTDTSILTAVGNDYGFDEVFARQVRALVRPSDLLIVHSTSGNSPNVRVLLELPLARSLRAVTRPHRHLVSLVWMLGGDGGEVVRRGGPAIDALVIPSTDTALIQEAHLAIEHLICGLVEEALA